jgi:hypothetical protein
VVKNLLLFVLMVAACSNAGSRQESDMQEDSGLDAAAKIADQQSGCFMEWRRLVEEWNRESGGVAGTLVETRQRIARDSKSAFSAFVRDVWASQIKAGSIKNFGAWPVDPVVEKQVVDHADAISETYVSKNCALHSFPRALLFNELSSREMPSTHRKLLETPPEMEWDPYQGGRYLLFWLLFSNDNPPSSD